jgi:hypothetical protein
MADWLWRRAGLRRAAEGRAARDPLREPAFDLLERAPDRAAVLLGMLVSLVAQAPYSPSATRVTERSQDVLAFLIADERRIGRTGPTRLGAVDTVLLAVIAVVTAGLATWVDVV